MAADNHKGNTPGAPPPQGVSNTDLKSIVISGTNLRWTVGDEAPYLLPVIEDDRKRYEWQVGIVLGLGIIVPPPAQQQADGGIFCQINIFYEDYRDLYICADHLILKNLHVSAIAVPVRPGLVLGG
jgi:hypothetical protein